MKNLIDELKQVHASGTLNQVVPDDGDFSVEGPLDLHIDRLHKYTDQQLTELHFLVRERLISNLRDLLQRIVEFLGPAYISHFGLHLLYGRLSDDSLNDIIPAEKCPLLWLNQQLVIHRAIRDRVCAVLRPHS